ncbi:tRNA (N(6)-L-threonylcarbamoyladenosine(37)-C(2))-methylthiotransferase MtaB [Deltaproteobacteria bacterium IMCC39524]|nr:tRNA (N(6)-L-threonylcarbamoyladenosine(37)-C(2))-methylthiotransferase MtaB [Deltaproteobacteria bacterium IMCC39524]
MSSIDKNEHPAPRHTPRATVSFATLGCKTNQFESASMQESLQSAGYQVVPFDEGADLVIVNTCTVTNATDAQSRNLIRRARKLNGACRVVVTGCYAQVDPEALQELPGVSLVIGNEEKQSLLDYLTEDQETTAVVVSDIRQVEKVCLPPLTTFSGRSRAFVQIQNGCDAFCSYCIIPYARGASRSAPPDEILQQIDGLVAAGFQEIVLTGIHIGGYGADLDTPMSLNDLVRRIEVETGIRRLRLGSIEPTELTEELLETVASSQVICQHLHIPLQAGNDHVLRRMKRTYNTEFFGQLLERVRASIPDAAICLDVITGFPGETEEEFESAYNFISRLPMTGLHVFPYSKRPGTPAAGYSDQVTGDVSKARAERLRQLAAEKHRSFAEGFIGEELEIVVESGEKEGLLKGVSRNYLDIRFSGEAALSGQCVMVKAVCWQDESLHARLL